MMFGGKEMFCTACGSVATPKKITPGSFLIEVILWCAFLVPGIVYSIWRISSKYLACPKCKNKNMIPTDSPMAIQMKNAMGSK